jgi:selenoprotein W-related protein
VEIELVPSGGGVFEVSADGELLHSKRETGRFPEPSWVVKELRGRATRS